MNQEFKCTFCSKNNFTKEETLFNHIRTHLREKPFDCKYCKKLFGSTHTLRQHILTHEKKRFKCKLCPKEMISSSGLIYHMKKNHLKQTKKQRDNLTCNICHKVLSHLTGLRVHKLGHSGIKAFECKVCDSRFITKQRLEEHMMVHTKERPFSCYFCNKGFSRKRGLDRHLVNHTLEKAFKCLICKREFIEEYRLFGHSPCCYL